MKSLKLFYKYSIFNPFLLNYFRNNWTFFNIAYFMNFRNEEFFPLVKSPETFDDWTSTEFDTLFSLWHINDVLIRFSQYKCESCDERWTINGKSLLAFGWLFSFNEVKIIKVARGKYLVIARDDVIQSATPSWFVLSHLLTFNINFLTFISSFPPFSVFRVEIYRCGCQAIYEKHVDGCVKERKNKLNLRSVV